MKNIGDTVWVARIKLKDYRIICPDCLGTKAVTLILENGERHILECKICCPGGYDGPRGYIIKTQYTPDVQLQEIVGIEITSEKTIYRFHDWSTDKVFESRDEAIVEANRLREELETDAMQRFIFEKENAKRTWAWNYSYYKQQIRDAKQTLAYAEARLNVCKQKAKEPGEEITP